MIPAGVSLVHLRRFLVIAEELHFSRAAERMGISQPLLSEQVRDLEALIGVRLFERSSRRVELTPAGHLFRERVNLVLLSLDEGITGARDVHGGGKMPIRIGYTDEFAGFVLPQLVQRLKEEHAGAQIFLSSNTAPNLLQLLDSGLLDLVLLCPMPEGPPKSEWGVLMFTPMSLAVGVHSGHPLTKLPAVRLAQIGDEQFIECPADPSAGSSASEIVVDRLFARHGLRRNIVQRLDDPYLAASLAAAGVGVYIVSLPGAVVVEGLHTIPIADPYAALPAGAIYRESNKTKLLETSREFLKAVADTSVSDAPQYVDG